MFAIASFFGRRNETLVRSCQPAMYSASAGFTRAAEVRFDVLERRAITKQSVAEDKPVVNTTRIVKRHAAVAQCGTADGQSYGYSNHYDTDTDFEDSFYAYAGQRLDPDVTNVFGTSFFD